ncbi:MAG: hypothetical protein ACFHX7_13350 [Pseudomonadota bacterium]
MTRQNTFLTWALLALLPAVCLGTPHIEYEVQAGVPTTLVDDVQLTLARESERLFAELSAEVQRVRLRFFSDKRRFTRQTANQTVSSANGRLRWDGTSWEVNLLYTGLPLSEPSLRGLSQIAMLTLNPAMADGPVWLWEAISSYEARQFISPFQLSCITLSQVPTLEALNQAPLASRLGYLMGEFLFNEYGNKRVADLIRAAGNVELILDRTPEQFMDHFQRYVTGRYLISNPVPPALSAAELQEELVDRVLHLDDGRAILLEKRGTIRLTTGNRVQTGEWSRRAPDSVCWQLLNFAEFCTVFRRFEGRYWLDTPADCERYPLRVEQAP